MLEVWMKFIWKAVPRTTLPCSLRVSPLNHELRNDAMKLKSIKKRLSGLRSHFWMISFCK
jgi:hypothetical protein